MFPREQREALDSFNLETIITAAAVKGPLSAEYQSLLHKIRCDHTLKTCLSKLPNNITSGADNIHNELIRIEPQSAQGTIPLHYHVDHAAHPHILETVQHNPRKMRMIMHDIGFPQDSIEVVRDLYMDATTEITLQQRTTASITVERGTIQGDTLSPTLFLYMNPYYVGYTWVGVATCMDASPQLKRNSTTLFSPGVRRRPSVDHKRPTATGNTMAEVATLYFVVRGMSVNPDKSGVTCMLHD